MALIRLDGFEDRMKESVKSAATIFAALNQTDGIKVNALDNGTNIYQAELSKGIDGKKFRDKLRDGHNIRVGMPNDKNRLFLMVNESLITRDAASVIDAFKDALRSSQR